MNLTDTTCEIVRDRSEPLALDGNIISEAAGRAANGQSRLVIDRDIVMFSDALICSKVHIAIPLGVTVTVNAGGRWDHAVAGNGALFTFTSDASGSILECDGTIDLGVSHSGVTPYAVGMINCASPVLLRGNPDIRNATFAGFLQATDFWADRVWQGYEFASVSGDAA